MARRIPLTIRHVVTGDESRMTIPARLASKTGAQLLALHRLDPRLFRVVGPQYDTPGVEVSASVGARVGLVIGTAWPDCIGGGEIVWKAVGAHLQTMGYEVHVFAWVRATYGSGTVRPIPEADQKDVEGMAYHYVPQDAAIPYIRQWSQEARPVALWTTFGWGLAFNLRLTTLSGLAPLLCYQQFWMGMDADTFAIPEDPESAPEWRALFDAPDTLVLNSEFAARRFAHSTGREIEVLTPPTEDALGTSTRDGAILMIGAGFEKGTDIVRRVADHFPEERFVIIGDSPAIHSENCESVGWADPRPYFTRAKALLAPSLVTETYGMAVEESRKWGIPTIVSDNGALRDHAEIALSTADLPAWVAATESVLSGRVSVTGPVLRKRDALRQLEGVMRRADTEHRRPLGDEQFPTIATYSGVKHTSVAYLNASMVDVFGLTDYPGGTIPDGVRYCLLHSWSDGQADMFALLRDGGVHPFAVLHSPMAQGEIDGEHGVFEQVIPLGPSHVLCGHAPMARALGCRWLPVPIRTDPLERLRRGPREAENPLRVGMWNTWSPRKNTWTQMLAARELSRISGRPVEIHGPMQFNSLNMAIAGNVSLFETRYAPQRDYYEQMGGMDLNLQVTHAESFNYTAMESYLLGAPCLVGPCTPAGRFGMEGSFVVDDPTDPILIAQMAWKAIQDAQEPWFHSLMIRSAMELVDYRHRALRDTLEAIERGDL